MTRVSGSKVDHDDWGTQILLKEGSSAIHPLPMNVGTSRLQAGSSFRVDLWFSN